MYLSEEVVAEVEDELMGFVQLWISQSSLYRDSEELGRNEKLFQLEYFK